MGDIKDLMESAADVAEEGVELAYKDVAHPTLSVIGKTLGTVIEFACMFAIPIEYLSKKVKLNFQHRLNQYAEKLKSIPEEQRVEVHTQIGVPVVQRLSYTTSDEIADLFMNLLLTASDTETMSDAHPAFISMIDRLSQDEAKIVQYLEDANFILYCEAKYILKREKPNDIDKWDFSTKFITVCHWATNIPYHVKLSFPENCNLYLTNLISLGILIDKPGFSKIGVDEQYEEIIENNKLKELEEKMDKEEVEKLEISKSYFEVTDLGKRFIRACCNK